MTNRQPIPKDAVLVAIDVAKARNEVLIEAADHQRRRRLSVMNSRTEHDRLIEILARYERPVVCGFEATGNYHRPLAWRLIEAGFEARLVSSMALARTREALHNGWDKNDPKDAQVILHMLKIGATQHYYDPLKAGINDIQELSKTHEVISKAKTEIQHRILTHYLSFGRRGYGIHLLAFDPQRLARSWPLQSTSLLLWRAKPDVAFFVVSKIGIALEWIGRTTSLASVVKNRRADGLRPGLLRAKRAVPGRLGSSECTERVLIRKRKPMHDFRLASLYSEKLLDGTMQRLSGPRQCR